MNKPGSVGEGISAENASWTFGNDTPKKFTEHVRRSVPFYDEGHDLVQQVSDFYVQSDSICYELGVSTGVLIKKLAARHKKSVKWVGIDREPNMIKQANLEIKESGLDINNIELLEDDINLFPYEPSDFMIAYYTAQFIPPRLRQDLINKIYQSLNWGGAFVMFEKVRGPDARFQDIYSSIYAEYKLTNGYSPDEVIAKSRSLKGVLEPFSTQGNLDMLKRAGFVDVSTIFKWVCFEGFLCIK
jgi:tRNA (cmo5U34)-methyltransferase